MRNRQTIAVERGASCLIVLCDAPIAQDVIDPQSVIVLQHLLAIPLR